MQFLQMGDRELTGDAVKEDTVEANTVIAHSALAMRRASRSTMRWRYVAGLSAWRRISQKTTPDYHRRIVAIAMGQDLSADAPSRCGMLDCHGKQ